jgi:hypothetical protein
MISPAPPFTCTYSPNVAELLIQLNCSLAITTFQAGKLIFLSPDGPNVMRQRYVSMFIHLPTDANVGHIRYEQSVEEIYDIQILPGFLRPGILNHTSPKHRLALHTPEAVFFGCPQSQKQETNYFLLTTHH